VGGKDAIKDFQKRGGKILPLVKPAEKCHKQAKKSRFAVDKKGARYYNKFVTD
jgi:hypothetical protein